MATTNFVNGTTLSDAAWFNDVDYAIYTLLGLTGDDGAQTFSVATNLIWANAAGPVILNEAATTTNPTLCPNKAELDTGWGWASDVLWSVTGGVQGFGISNTQLIAANATGPAVLNEPASTANPTLVPNQADPDTGIGWVSADLISFVAGGVDTMLMNTTDIVNNVAGGEFRASNAAGPSMINEAATATNPTLIPNRAELDTGWGWASDELWAVLGGGAYARFDSASVQEFNLYNYDNDATVGPGLRLVRAKGGSAGVGGVAGVANDILGAIRFVGYNDAATPAEAEYARVHASIIDATAAAPDGQLTLAAMKGGALTDVAHVKSDGAGLTYLFLDDAAGPALMNEAATTTNPTIIPNRAELDTGWGWSTDSLEAVLGGTRTWNLGTTAFVCQSQAAGPALIAEDVTATNPTLCPNKADADTGIGWEAADHLALIAGGIELVECDDDGVALAAGSSIADKRTLEVSAKASAFTNHVAYFQTATTAGSGFNLISAVSDFDGTPDTEFKVRGDGEVYGDGAAYNTPADYAEMFEWEDGNPLDEDRAGVSVAIVGGKIKEAVAGDDIVGVISATPAIKGESGWKHWQGKYLRDDYGRFIWGEHEVSEMVFVNGPLEDQKNEKGKITEQAGKPHTTWVRTERFKPHKNGKRWLTGNTKMQPNKVLNPAWDETVEYIPREDRPEWDYVGLLGKLWVRDGQQVNSRWIQIERNDIAGLTRYLVR